MLRIGKRSSAGLLAMWTLFGSTAASADVLSAESSGRFSIDGPKTFNWFTQDATASLRLSNRAGARDASAAGFPNPYVGPPAFPPLFIAPVPPATTPTAGPGPDGFLGSNGAGAATSNVALGLKTIKGLGYLNTPKYPPGAGGARPGPGASHSASLRVNSMTAANTVANSDAEWTSTDAGGALGFFNRSWGGTTRAIVGKANKNAPDGVAIASIADPWIFTTPSDPAPFDVTITVSDLVLAIDPELTGTALFRASFALDKIASGDVVVPFLHPKPFEQIITSGSFELGSQILLKVDGLMLEPNTVYRLSADVQSEVDVIPEPATYLMVLIGTMLLVVRSWKRLGQRHAELASRR